MSALLAVEWREGTTEATPHAMVEPTNSRFRPRPVNPDRRQWQQICLSAMALGCLVYTISSRSRMMVPSDPGAAAALRIARGPSLTQVSEPSIHSSAETSVLINPAHPDFAQLVIGNPVPFASIVG